MKNKSLLICFFITVIIISCVYISNRLYSKLNLLSATLIYPSIAFSEDIQYGKSPYEYTNGSINISLERITNEKYFITYSLTNGNKSNFTLVFLLEDINKKKLSKNTELKIELMDDLGKIYNEPFYYTFLDFPRDDPLGYKKIIYIKFLPLDESGKILNIKVTYLQKDYYFLNIPIN